MILGGGLFGIVVLCLWVYCVFDVIRTDGSLCQNLPKPLWLLIVILVPTIGSLAWLLLGRPQGAPFGFGSGPGGHAAPTPTPAVRPIDPAEHQRWREEALRRHRVQQEAAERERDLEIEKLRLAAWEDELRRREKDLRGKQDAGE